jgi:hypothetical protein
MLSNFASEYAIRKVQERKKERKKERIGIEWNI